MKTVIRSHLRHFIIVSCLFSDSDSCRKTTPCKSVPFTGPSPLTIRYVRGVRRVCGHPLQTLRGKRKAGSKKLRGLGGASVLIGVLKLCERVSEYVEG